ncbi:MAG: hypothetical protein AB8B63_21210 [Granulosicoccus sp.]
MAPLTSNAAELVPLPEITSGQNIVSPGCEKQHPSRRVSRDYQARKIEHRMENAKRLPGDWRLMIKTSCILPTRNKITLQFLHLMLDFQGSLYPKLYAL